MKKFISFLIVCMLLCSSVFAVDYRMINLPEFSNVDNFSEGLCAVQDKLSGRWGFVDTDKKWVISPQFQSASYFKNGLCAVNTINGESVLIDKKGNIIIKRPEFSNYINSENFYVEKHGKYNIVFDGDSFSWITLLDENYNPIVPTDAKLRTFNASTNGMMYKSKTVFWSVSQKRVYNYKGIDITEKLAKERIALSVETVVNNKYIIGQIDSKIKCFDIYGNKIAEFKTDSKYSLDGDFIVCKNKIYNIAKNKIVFENKENDIEKIETYYSKFFTVKRQNGTSALYSSQGDILVDFGKWDYIYPSSVSNNIVVSTNGKYGVADYNSKLLLPVDFGMGKVFASNSGTMEYSPLSDDGKYAGLIKNGSLVNVDLSTLKSHYGNSETELGYKYHLCGNTLLDNNLNAIYTFDKSTDFSSLAFLDDGRIKVSRKSNPQTYGFFVLNSGGIKVELDNTRLAFDVLPVIKNGRTLVPMRAIFEALGADVEWDGKTQTITAKNKDVTIQMQIGSNTLIKNGESLKIDVCPQLVGGRTMVPVRAVSDSFNVTVDWNGYTQTVSLFTN